MNRRSTERLLWCGVIGPPLFVLVALIEGTTRSRYDPIRLPISLLSLGDMGWTQTLNFLVFGVLMLAFSVGLWSIGQSKVGSVLMTLFSLGLIAVGLFPTDPGGGYPPGVPASSTSTGTLHDLFTLLTFASLALASLVFGRAFARMNDRAWAWYSGITAVLVVIGFVAMFTAFSDRNELTRFGGVIQRLTVIVGWLWITLLAIREIRAPGIQHPRDPSG